MRANSPGAVSNDPDQPLRFFLAALQLFIGIGGVAGGLGLALDPSGGNLGMPAEWLSGSPFRNYLVPGLVLLTVNGLGNIAGGILTLIRATRYAGAAIGLGAFLMAWIVLQVFWIQLLHWLHPLYFGLGAIELGFGVRLRRK